MQISIDSGGVESNTVKWLVEYENKSEDSVKIRVTYDSRGHHWDILYILPLYVVRFSCPGMYTLTYSWISTSKYDWEKYYTVREGPARKKIGARLRKKKKKVSGHEPTNRW